MSNEQKDGGPAFPSSNDVRLGDISTGGHAGLSLRDYFAAKAIQALLKSNTNIDPDHIQDDTPSVVRKAYHMADWMLKAREQ